MNYDHIYIHVCREGIEQENIVSDEKWQTFVDEYLVFIQQEANELACEMFNDFINGVKEDVERPEVPNTYISSYADG